MKNVLRVQTKRCHQTPARAHAPVSRVPLQQGVLDAALDAQRGRRPRAPRDGVRAELARVHVNGKRKHVPAGRHAGRGARRRRRGGGWEDADVSGENQRGDHRSQRVHLFDPCS
jgi:hypothetical protein